MWKRFWMKKMLLMSWNCLFLKIALERKRLCYVNSLVYRSLAQGMLSLMKRRDRLSEGGEIEFKPRTPSRPEGKSKR